MGKITRGANVGLGDRQANGDIAGKLLGVDAVLLIDVSGSMAAEDAGVGGNRSRWDVLVDVVVDVVREAGPQRVAVVAFNDSQSICTTRIQGPEGGTDIGGAIRFLMPVARQLRRTVLISDGEPTTGGGNPLLHALEAARSYPGQIDVVYIGPEHGNGRGVLRQIANVSGGTYQKQTLLRPQELTVMLTRMALPAPIAL